MVDLDTRVTSLMISNMREIKVMISDEQIKQAARIAEAMTADPGATGNGDPAWDAQDVLNAAVTRGLDALEQSYTANSQQRNCSDEL